MHPKAIEILDIVEDVHTSFQQNSQEAGEILKKAKQALVAKEKEAEQVEEERRDAYKLLCTVALNFLGVCEKFHLEGQPLVLATGLDQGTNSADQREDGRKRCPFDWNCQINRRHH